MPLTKTGKRVMKTMVKEYGTKRGKAVFYAMEHKHKNWIKGPK